MKALTIHQPWAGMIAAGWKRIETRTWRTKHRGQIAIHASQTYDLDAMDVARQHKRWLADKELPEPLDARGAIIAVGQIFDVIRLEGPGYHRLTLCDYEGLWSWTLGRIMPLDLPIACRGMPGLWTVPDEIEARIITQLMP